MNYLIELNGNGKGCVVTPTVGRSYTSRKGDDYSVDMDLIRNAGCDGFLSVTNSTHFSIYCIAFGMHTYIQVELPYPWSKHELTSNVPIKAYCQNGYFDSVCHVIKSYFKGGS